MDDHTQKLNPGKAVLSSLEDKLGFTSPARHLARALAELASPEGLVVGIEGEWGAGKSSFVNIVAEALEREEAPPVVVRFTPWLIGSRAGLISELMIEITRAAIEIKDRERIKIGGGSWYKKLISTGYLENSARKKELRKVSERFMNRLIQAGKVAELYGVAGAGVAASAAGATMSEFLKDDSLEQEKNALRIELSKLSQRIVVIIDDIDRLEPSEAVEVLRLVRAVVDFPNVLFLLCYSRTVLANSIEMALSIENGEDFLEKIIQVCVPVPRPEAFDLRQLFELELQKHLKISRVANEDSGESVTSRLTHIIDSEGGRALTTPRKVFRAANSIRLSTNGVTDNIDLPDLIWLQLIRVQSTALYQWIEEYLIEQASTENDGAYVPEDLKKSLERRLEKILGDLDAQGTPSRALLRSLAEVLPGLQYEFNNEDEKPRAKAFCDFDKTPYIVHSRLGSNQHYRYYFAQSLPRNSLSNDSLASFIEAARENQDQAINQLFALADQVTGTGRLRCYPLLDHLAGLDYSRQPRQTAKSVVAALAASMDPAALREGIGSWGEYNVWREARKVFGKAWESAEPEDKTSIIDAIFNNQPSIGWITSIVREEVFSHGIFGGQGKHPSERVFSPTEMKKATQLLVNAYDCLSPHDLQRLPKLLPILYTWVQIDPQNDAAARSKFRELVQEDQYLLLALDKMRSWRSDSVKVVRPILQTNLRAFGEINEIVSRLENIKGHTDRRFSSKAAQILDSIEDDLQGKPFS